MLSRILRVDSIHAFEQYRRLPAKDLGTPTFGDAMTLNITYKQRKEPANGDRTS